MGPPLSEVYALSDTPLENTNFSSISGCHLDLASGLGVGAHVHFLLLVLGLHMAETSAGPVHGATRSLQVHLCVSLVSGRHCFFGVSHLLWLFQFLIFMIPGTIYRFKSIALCWIKEMSSPT